MLSVIMPVYNGEKTVKKAIESVLIPMQPELELIVVNDGSTDKTAQILEGIIDPRLKVITTPNRGQGMARNTAIDVAIGDYIGFLDADDTVTEDMYTVMYGMAKEHDADVIQCAINDITPDKVEVRPITDDCFVRITDRREYMDRYVYTLIHTNEVCNKLFKRSFLVKNGIRFSDTRKVYSEDLKFNLDVLGCIEVIGFTGRGMYNYYITPDGHCKKDPKSRFFGIDTLYKEIIEKTEDKHIRRCIKSMAQITLLQYAIEVLDDVLVKKVITSLRLKDYLLASLVYKGTFRHTLLMLTLVCAPYAIKKKIIKKHYSF